MRKWVWQEVEADGRPHTQIINNSFNNNKLLLFGQCKENTCIHTYTAACKDGKLVASSRP